MESHVLGKDDVIPAKLFQLDLVCSTLAELEPASAFLVLAKKGERGVSERIG